MKSCGCLLALFHLTEPSFIEMHGLRVMMDRHGSRN